MGEWFSVCDEGAFVVHDSEAAAKAAAQSALDAVRDYAESDGEWVPEVAHIRWGCVIGRAAEMPVHGHPGAADYVLREWVAPVDWREHPVWRHENASGIIQVFPAIADPVVMVGAIEKTIVMRGSHRLTPDEAEALGRALISAAAEAAALAVERAEVIDAD